MKSRINRRKSKRYWIMRRLRQCSERNFGWAFDKVQTEGWIGGMHAMLRRQVRNEFGLNTRAEWLDLVAEPRTAY